MKQKYHFYTLTLGKLWHSASGKFESDDDAIEFAQHTLVAVDVVCRVGAVIWTVNSGKIKGQ